MVRLGDGASSSKTEIVWPNLISISGYFDCHPPHSSLLLMQMVIANYTLGARCVKATASHNMLLGCLCPPPYKTFGQILSAISTNTFYKIRQIKVFTFLTSFVKATASHNMLLACLCPQPYKKFEQMLKNTFVKVRQTKTFILITCF